MDFGPAESLWNRAHHRPIHTFSFVYVRPLRLSTLPFSLLLDARFKMTKLGFPHREVFILWLKRTFFGTR